MADQLTAEEIVKIVLGVIGIGFLIYLSASLIGIFMYNSDMEKAKSLMNEIIFVSESSEEFVNQILLNGPFEWRIISENGKTCICQKDGCPEKGICEDITLSILGKGSVCSSTTSMNLPNCLEIGKTISVLTLTKDKEGVILRAGEFDKVNLGGNSETTIIEQTKYDVKSIEFLDYLSPKESQGDYAIYLKKGQDEILIIQNSKISGSTIDPLTIGGGGNSIQVGKIDKTGQIWFTEDIVLHWVLSSSLGYSSDTIFNAGIRTGIYGGGKLCEDGEEITVQESVIAQGDNPEVINVQKTLCKSSIKLDYSKLLSNL